MAELLLGLSTMKSFALVLINSAEDSQHSAGELYPPCFWGKKLR